MTQWPLKGTDKNATGLIITRTDKTAPHIRGIQKCLGNVINAEEMQKTP